MAQPRPCLPLPQVPPVAARRLGGAGVNTDPKPGSGGGGGGANRSAAGPSFVLLWSTAAVSFSLRARRCLESIFYHHADARVQVYALALSRALS